MCLPANAFDKYHRKIPKVQKQIFVTRNAIPFIILSAIVVAWKLHHKGF